MRRVTNLFPFIGSHSGASLVEAAIGLPIFLAIVFGIIWFGITMNQKSTFNYALGLAPRAALPRGDRHVIGSEIISSIQAWIASNNISSASPALRELLSSPAEEALAFTNGGHYMTSWNALGAGGNLNRVPPSYVYAQVYFFQTLRQGVGNSIRFPCDPNPASPLDGEGCARCSNTLAAPTQSLAPGQPLDRRFVGLDCEFRPPSTLMKPIMALLGGTNSLFIFRGSGKYKLELDNTGDIAP